MEILLTAVQRAKGAKQETKTEDVKDEEDEEEENIDRVSAEEAWLFPIVGVFKNGKWCY